MERRHIPPLIKDAYAHRRNATLAGQVAVAGLSPIAAIVFDAYGTLFDLAAIERACAAVTDDAAALAGLWRAKQLEYSWLRSLMGRYADFAAVTAEALDYALAGLPHTPSGQERRRLLDAWLSLDPFPDVPAALARLRARPLAILSNGSPAMLAAAVRHAGLADAFEHLLSVDAAGAYKPDPRVYALAPAALGVPAANILFVSANGWDVVGAKASGFTVAWCNRAGRARETHGPGADLEVASLEHLAEIVLPPGGAD